MSDSPERNLLQEYVQSPHSSYGFQLKHAVATDDCTVDFLWLTSQTWQSIPWRHWLTVVRPQQIVHTDKVLLIVSGGDLAQEDSPGRIQDEHVRQAHLIATLTHATVAVLQQVPNQPLFEGRVEDALIAFTFDKYLKGEGDGWPLLFPMVNSAVRAMDAIQTFLSQNYGQNVERFVATGASKRGWTTWLLAAADPRIAGIAPMVFDVLSIGEQMAHQLRVYGAFSDKIDDYTQLKIQERMATPEGLVLLRNVDPYAHLERLTAPKLVILGTNDEYWTADSATLYYDNLPGEKYLHYEPNGDHALGPGAVFALMGFWSHFLAGTPMPRFMWRRAGAGIEIFWTDAPKSLRLWHAHSPNRDFRQAQWVVSDLPLEQGDWIGVETPKSGWTAFFASLQYPSVGDRTFALSTAMTVIPKRYPGHVGPP